MMDREAPTAKRFPSRKWRSFFAKRRHMLARPSSYDGTFVKIGDSTIRPSIFVQVLNCVAVHVK